MRISWVARLLASHGVKVLVPAIAPYADARDAVRGLHESSGADYLEVYVCASVEIGAERDVKGLYARQATGEISHLTGVDDPYEVPDGPDPELPAERQSVTESVEAVRGLLK
jgi:adenylylsulfate kinase